MRKLHVPRSWARGLACRFERFRAFPFTTEQLAMLEEDNTCDPRPFLRTFAIELIEFESGIARYVGRRFSK